MPEFRVHLTNSPMRRLGRPGRRIAADRPRGTPSIDCVWLTLSLRQVRSCSVPSTVMVVSAAEVDPQRSSTVVYSLRSKRGTGTLHFGTASEGHRPRGRSYAPSRQRAGPWTCGHDVWTRRVDTTCGHDVWTRASDDDTVQQKNLQPEHTMSPREVGRRTTCLMSLLARGHQKREDEFEIGTHHSRREPYGFILRGQGVCWS